MLALFRRFGHPDSCVIHAVLYGLAALVLAAAPATQAAAVAPSVHMRLVAATGLDQGVYHVAAEIELQPKAITYWRDPGEAGVPPKFSFEGSQNVAMVEAFFPSPSRIEEDGIEAFGYRGGIVFPIHVTPIDATEPSVLKLTLDYAVCESICVPVRSDAEIILPPHNADAANELVAAAEARVPAKLSPADRQAKAVIAPQRGTTKPTWSLTWKDGEGLEDLFVEAPEGWYVDARKVNAHEFSLVLAAQPAGAGRGSLDIRVTAVGQHRSYEFAATLDPSSFAAPH
jgi:DsbC/DsbD-like thiol-disulfide interchange protein